VFGVDTNRISATGIDDPSQKENRVGAVIANQKHEWVIAKSRIGVHDMSFRAQTRSESDEVQRHVAEERVFGRVSPLAGLWRAVCIRSHRLTPVASRLSPHSGLIKYEPGHCSLGLELVPTTSPGESRGQKAIEQKATEVTE
jgi:hypothetical protein